MRARRAQTSAHTQALTRRARPGIGADGTCDSSAKVDWCANTANFDNILAGACARAARARHAMAQHARARHARSARACADAQRARRPADRGRHGGGCGAACALTPAQHARACTRTAHAHATHSHAPSPPHAPVQPRKKKSKKADKERGDKAAKAPAPARGRPQGRYGKREAGKLVSGYSAADLSMILGIAPTEAFAAPPAMQRAQSDSDGDADEDAEAAAAAAAKAERKKRRRARSPAAPDAPAAPAAPAADAAAAAAAAAADASDATEDEDEEEGFGAPPADWWGASTFRRAGRLGGIRRSAKKEKSGFCEDDQVDAYNKVHDGATQGKRGLGIKDAPKKVAGARWAGSKVTFGDAEEAEDAEADADAPEAAAAKKIKWKARDVACHVAGCTSDEGRC